MSMFFGADRALAVRGPAIPLVAGAPALVPLKLQGREGINSLFEYRLVLQTPDACDFMAGEGSNFDLDAFVGRELTCAIELEGHGSFVPGVPGGLGAHQGAGEREISGLVTQARFIGESGRHALYELTLRPWLHLATLTTDCRVFQDQSPVEIIEDVLARYAFSPTDALTSGSYSSRDYDHTRPRATLEVSAAAPRPTGHAQQAVYLWRGDRAGIGGSDYSQPNRGADKAAHRTEAQGEHLARLRMQVLRQGGRRATGVGHLRGIVAGCTFALTGHPRERANVEYVVLETRFVIENVGEDAQRAVQATGLTALSDAQRLSGQWRVAVEFDVQPTTEALRPEAVQRKPKTGGPETAVVVGPDAGTAETNIYTDALGRIKVQFPWDRHGQKNQNSSCWVRVASAWAGNQLGAMQVPRVGQEVVVDFLGGDPDLADLAQQHRAQEAGDQGEVTRSLKAQNGAIAGQGGDFPELSEPYLTLASPAGIQSTTAGSTHHHSDGHHAVTAGGHASVSTARSWLVSATEAIKLFAYRAGMKLIAARADIDIQAFKTSVNFLAKVDITHTANRITLTAKEEIVVNGGGSYTAWKSDGIEEGTAGAWVSHAATHDMAGPANLSVAPMTMPTALLQSEPGTLVFDVLTQPEDVAGTAWAAEPYELLKGGVVIEQGLTNERGQVVVKNHQPGTTTYQVRFSHGGEHELWVSEALDHTSEHRLANHGYRTDTHHRDRATGNGFDKV